MKVKIATVSAPSTSPSCLMSILLSLVTLTAKRTVFSYFEVSAKRNKALQPPPRPPPPPKTLTSDFTITIAHDLTTRRVHFERERTLEDRTSTDIELAVTFTHGQKFSQIPTTIHVFEGRR